MEAEGENGKNDAKNTSNPPELVGTNHNRRRSSATITLHDGYPRQGGADADVSSFDGTSEHESSIGEKSSGESFMCEDSGHYSWTMPGEKGFTMVPYSIHLSDSDSDSDMEPESDYDEESDERRPVILMDPTMHEHDSQPKFRRSLCEFSMEGFDFPRGEIRFNFKQAYVMKGGIIEMIRDQLASGIIKTRQLPFLETSHLTQYHALEAYPANQRQRLRQNRLVESLFISILGHGPTLEGRSNPSMQADIEALEAGAKFKLEADLYIFDAKMMYFILLTNKGWYLSCYNMESIQFLTNDEDADVLELLHKYNRERPKPDWERVVAFLPESEQSETGMELGTKWWENLNEDEEDFFDMNDVGGDYEF